MTEKVRKIHWSNKSGNPENVQNFILFHTSKYTLYFKYKNIIAYTASQMYKIFFLIQFTIHLTKLIQPSWSNLFFKGTIPYIYYSLNNKKTKKSRLPSIVMLIFVV